MIQKTQNTQIISNSDTLTFRTSDVSGSPSFPSVPKALAVVLLVLNVLAISGFMFLPVPKPYTLIASGSRRVLGDQTQAVTLTYPLLEGWNLVHFPLKPEGFATAAQLVKNVAQSGGYVTTIATWQDGTWKEYIQRGATAYSADFPIIPGQAYFLRSHQQHDWQVTGTPVSVDTLALKPGWNSIGLTPGPDTNAANLLDALNQTSSRLALSERQRVERTPEIDHWLSGTWQVFVKRIYSPENIQEYGDNFALSATQGYMLKSNEFLELRLENSN